MSILLQSLLVIINVVGLTFLYILLVKSIKKTSFYRKLLQLKIQVSSVPDRVKTKGDLRRAKRLQPYTKEFRRKILLYTLINTSISMAIYMFILYSTFHFVFFVESPVIVPLFSFLVENRVYAYSHLLFILSLALMSYPIYRETRLD